MAFKLNLSLFLLVLHVVQGKASCGWDDILSLYMYVCVVGMVFSLSLYVCVCCWDGILSLSIYVCVVGMVFSLPLSLSLYIYMCVCVCLYTRLQYG